MIHIESSKLVVIKIGVSQLFDIKLGEFNVDWLASLAEDIKHYTIKFNVKFILVVSGAYVCSAHAESLNIAKLKLQEKQFYSVLGNQGLMMRYHSLFDKVKIMTVPLYITIEDIENRKRFLSAKAIIENMIAKSYLPIVIENDLVTSAELRFGDSDRLSAKIAHLTDADLLVLFSRVDGLYTEDPQINGAARFVKEIYDITTEIEKMATDSSFSSGGMSAKIAAAKIAVNSGTNCVIMREGIRSPLSKLDIGFKASRFCHSSTGNKKFVID